jgi:type VI secretion system protein VasD
MSMSPATQDAVIDLSTPRRGWPSLGAVPRRLLMLWAGGIKVALPPPPPPPKPTVVTLELNATAQLNPDTRGRPSPLLVRLYELTTPVGFEALDFAVLQADDVAGLKPALQDKYEHVLAPGATVNAKLQPTEAVKFIGVFASFRDLTRAQWRAVVPVKPNTTQRIQLRFDDRSIGAQASVLP